MTTPKPPEQPNPKVTPAGPGGGNVLSPGTLIGGKFRIENRIARGGQASVYLARQEPLNRPVALKILSPPSMESTEEEREAFEHRFLLEARTLAGLDHPNIVTVFDYGETDDGRYYLAMEHIGGGRFLDLLKRGHLESGRAVGLTLQVAQALRYAHKRGVVHRDVKNSNVLVRRLDSGEEQVKVVDFGLVKLSKMDSGLTQTGMILGSPHFIAPEQATGQGIDHRADIYATGVLLYCGLTGKYPFDGPHATAVITAHVTRDVPSFASVAPEVRIPEGLEAVVRRCLEKRPGRRFPSMDALIAELLPYHSGSPMEIESGEFHTLTAGHVIQPKRDWTALWAGLIVGGVIAILLAMLVITAVLGYRLRNEEAAPLPDVHTVEAEPTQTSAPPPQPTEQPKSAPAPKASKPTVEATPPSPSEAKSIPEPTPPKAQRVPASRKQPPVSPPVEPQKTAPPTPNPEVDESDWSDIDLGEAGTP